MGRHLDHARTHTPGRCDCCGHLMIMLRVNDLFTSLRSTQWHCLLCDRTLGWETMSRRYKAMPALTAPAGARRAVALGA